MDITPYQLDILQELINIGVGRAAGMLNQMVNTHIRLQVPMLTLLTPHELEALFKRQGGDRISAVKLGFSGELTGASLLLFPPESALRLVSVILGQDAQTAAIDELHVATLQEVGNIVLNGVMGSLGNLLEEHIDYAPVEYYAGGFRALLEENVQEQRMVLLVQTSFDVENLSIRGDIILLFRLETFRSLLQAIDKLAPAP